MTRAERDQLRRAIDRTKRATLGPTLLVGGTELDREPPHSACSLYAETRVHRVAGTGVDDETEAAAELALLGVRLASYRTPNGSGVPTPSVILGIAA